MENKEKKRRFAWLTHIFDFSIKYSLKDKEMHKTILYYLFIPLMLPHIFLILLISILSQLNVINLQMTPLISDLGLESSLFFLLLSMVSMILYSIAHLLLFYDIRELTEDERKLQKDKNHLRFILFLVSIAVLLQFVTLLFFSL